MPTFTAIALDRLIEPGASKPVHQSAPNSMPVLNSKKHERSSSESIPKKKAPPRPQLKPALYATPEVTPLPDSPSSFPPSPYIINHKRRGPRLLKSFSEANVQAKQKVLDDENVNGKSSDTVVASSSAGDLQATFSNPEPVKEEQVNGVYDTELSSSNGGDLGHGHRESGSSSVTNGLHLEKVVELNSERDFQGEDFFDPQDSMSLTSYTDGEDNTGTECAVKPSTPRGEFFDAWEGEFGLFTANYFFKIECARGQPMTCVLQQFVIGVMFRTILLLFFFYYLNFCFSFFFSLTFYLCHTT